LYNHPKSAPAISPYANPFWYKQVAIGDDDGMQPFGPVEELFKGRQFDGQIIILCVSWYTSFKLSGRRSPAGTSLAPETDDT